MNDHEVAAALADEAGRLLVGLRVGGGPDLKAEGDRQSNELLLSRLAELRPDDAVLSEESVDNPIRLDAERVWIIDPLDGTREFGEPPRTDWAVHVALTMGGAPVAGAVALPGLDVVLQTGAPPKIAPAHDGPPRLAVSRTRPPACTQLLVDAMDATLVEMGSAGAKAMAVV